MKITTSSLFCEPGFKFSVSHKVSLLIRQKMNDSIIGPYGLERLNPGSLLNLIVSTRSKAEEVKIMGPDYNKKDNIINWSLWLPYYSIVEAPDQLKAYLKYYFDAVVLVLSNYSVEEQVVRKVQLDIEKLVIGNPDYYFVSRN